MSLRSAFTKLVGTLSEMRAPTPEPPATRRPRPTWASVIAVGGLIATATASGCSCGNGTNVACDDAGVCMVCDQYGCHSATATKNSGTGGTGGTGGAGGAAAAKPVVLASTLPGPVDLFVDDTTVYWSETGAGPGQGFILSVPKDSNGIVPPTVIASGIDGPQGIWVDGGYVYWADRSGQYGSINRAPATGGAVELISLSADNATEVVVADGALYSNWIAEGVIARLETSAITGSDIVPPVFAATSPATHLATDGANLIWVQQGINSLTHAPTNSIVFSPLGTTAIRNFLFNTEDNHTIDAIAGDGINVYFTDSDGTNVSVHSIALTSGDGSNTTIATLSGTDSQGVGPDGANVFYTELDTGEVASSANHPGTVTGQKRPSRIVVEPTALYWIDAAASGGSVMKLTL
jgi:hypothetical protein